LVRRPVSVAYKRDPCGWVEPGHTPELENSTVVRGPHLPWKEEIMDDEAVDICNGLFLVGGVADRSGRM
jgi:hypothetical protein